MASPDYATWLTKQQAADAIGVSTKTVEKLAQDQQLQQARWRRPSGGPELAVYHPDDVARLAQARRPDPAAFVLPAGSDHPTSSATGNGHGALARTPPSLPATVPGDDVLRALLAAALRAVTSPTSQNSEKLFLTLDEASADSGLPVPVLRRFVRAGTLKTIRGRGGPFIRRRDLAQL